MSDLIYVVDDESPIREGLILYLSGTCEVRGFASGEDLLENLPRSLPDGTRPVGARPDGTLSEFAQPDGVLPDVAIPDATLPDVVLLDVGLPGMSGIEVLKAIRARHSQLPVIMITGHQEVTLAVEAMKLGAHDYVSKPLHMESLEVTLRNALETVRLRKEVARLHERYLLENVPCFIGESDAIQDVMALISIVARSPTTPVLILGETGTGKELIARSIHYRSPVARGPLISVNCGTIPRDLVESELFGYARGAFSGANISGKKGLVEEADGGTLFLDEIGDLSQDAQSKLLRFLELGEFYRVGSTRPVKIHTRVVSATNKDLEALIESGRFRADLYYRLSVVTLKVPSLNERRADIVPLASHFLVEYGRIFGREIRGISTEAREILTRHRWRGNIRELRNVIERAVLVAQGEEITSRDLGLGGVESRPSPQPPRSDVDLPDISDAGIPLQDILDNVERHYLEQAYGLAGGNESQAARLLNLNHHTYRYRRRKLSQ